MAEYFTSDTHFGHRNIIEYCKRPFADVAEMNEMMIQRWNAIVKPGDTVYHLGDFALGPKELWHGYRERLQGNIFFVVGNHDEPRKRWCREVLAASDDCFDLIDFVGYEDGEYRVRLQHEPPGYGQSSGWDFVLCGHVHDAWARKGNVINVGVDVRGFRPVTFKELIESPKR